VAKTCFNWSDHHSKWCMENPSFFQKTNKHSVLKNYNLKIGSFISQFIKGCVKNLNNLPWGLFLIWKPIYVYAWCLKKIYIQVTSTNDWELIRNILDQILFMLLMTFKLFNKQKRHPHLVCFFYNFLTSLPIGNDNHCRRLDQLWPEHPKCVIFYLRYKSYRVWQKNTCLTFVRTRYI